MLRFKEAYLTPPKTNCKDRPTHARDGGRKAAMGFGTQLEMVLMGRLFMQSFCSFLEIRFQFGFLQELAFFPIRLYRFVFSLSTKRRSGQCV